MKEKEESRREKEFQQISEAELASILENHKHWLESAGEKGEKAELKHTDLAKAVLRGAYLKRASLLSVKLDEADFKGADLFEAALVTAQLNRANLTGANLANANLEGAHLKGANLAEADMESASLGGATLTGANLKGADLNGASLKGVDLSRAKLDGARLYGANLNGANLRKATLVAANLEGADLTGADLRDADIRGARLHGANLEAANVSGVRYNRRGSFRGIRVATCYGSPRFKRFVQDQDFVEELKGDGLRGKALWFIWLVVADCGRSFILWGAWCVLFVFLFALIFIHASHLPGWAPDWFRDFSQWLGPAFEQQATNYRNIPLGLESALYLSVVTFTTLGFGDIVAANSSARFLVTVEVIVGYVMLAGLISILATKLGRRA